MVHLIGSDETANVRRRMQGNHKRERMSSVLAPHSLGCADPLPFS